MYGPTPIQGARDRQLSKHVDILSEHERSHEQLQSVSRPQSQLAGFRLIRDDNSTTDNQRAGESAPELNYEYHDFNFPWDECNESERSSESSSERQSLSHSATTRSSRTVSRRRSSAHLRKGSSVHSRGSSSDNGSKDGPWAAKAILALGKSKESRYPLITRLMFYIFRWRRRPELLFYFDTARAHEKHY